MNNSSRRSALTLVEMLVGMAITLVMMAAVVNLFANLGSGVRYRRATMEMSSQLRMARARLFKDLAGATSRAVPKMDGTKAYKADGYIEIIEGELSDTNPTELSSGDPGDDIDDTTIIPGSQVNPYDASGLGDYDDVLALTVRSETEPFVGTYDDQNVESNEAEVIWYAVENPANGALGEPGLRTVYRRALLIAPWLSPIITADDDPVSYYQDNDVSAHYDNSIGGWVPNTIADLVKRENRFMHDPNVFPHRMVSYGAGYGQDLVDRTAEHDPDSQLAGTPTASFTAVRRQPDLLGQGGFEAYRVTNGANYTMFPNIGINDPDPANPLTFVPTARPVMRAVNTTASQLAAVTFGPPPLAFDRQGEDVMLNDVLAFDLRVYDPGAPLFEYPAGTIVEPFDAVLADAVDNGLLPVGFGAYVDLGWDNDRTSGGGGPTTNEPDYVASAYPGAPETSFQEERQVGWHPMRPLQFRGTPAVYDTWSMHYETDGIDQDNRDGDAGDPNGYLTGADEGSNGLDDVVLYPDTGTAEARYGVDDPTEYETSPPYRVPLQGLQVKFRIFERDTRQIRESTVTRSFTE